MVHKDSTLVHKGAIMVHKDRTQVDKGLIDV